MLSIMICMDTTDYMRNGDYIPSRLSSQQEAINTIIHAHLRQNAENDAGIVTMTNNQVYSHLSTEQPRLNAKLYALQPEGRSIQLAKSIASANLALKHRQSKHARTKIVVFVGSPVWNCELDDLEMTEQKKQLPGWKPTADQIEQITRERLDIASRKTRLDLLGIARRLKKEKVCIDLVSFGELSDNEVILSDFISELGSDLGRMISVNEGNSIEDAVVSAFEIGRPTGSIGADGTLIAEEDDPDLMMALRISMEEENQRMNASQANAQDSSQIAQSTESVDQEMPITGDPAHMTEDEQIALAMQMSLASATKYQNIDDDDDDDEEDEEEDEIDENTRPE